MKRFFYALLVIVLCTGGLLAQGQLSGRLESFGNFFLRDSLIGAANTPQYDHQLYGAEAWLNLNYTLKGFEFRTRFDLFN
ncbi:MAG TPA: hypothetical protein ENJ88_04105, partial [Phaeodactylibacter sp.]|nr:hypothetical protein [Phaeodactylibacter sp.]